MELPISAKIRSHILLGVSNHLFVQQLFGPITKKTSILRTGHRWIPLTRATNEESASMSWRHYDNCSQQSPTKYRLTRKSENSSCHQPRQMDGIPSILCWVSHISHISTANKTIHRTPHSLSVTSRYGMYLLNSRPDLNAGNSLELSCFLCFWP